MTATGLSGANLLEVVDAGMKVDAAERGRIMLACAVANVSPERLDDFSLGQRDAWVVELRCATFGDTLASRVTCPDCGRLLSVRIPRGRVALQSPTSDPATARVQEGAVAVEARSPNGAELAKAAGCADIATARWSLISSCIMSALRDGEPVDPLELDNEMLERVGEAIVAVEPQIEVRVAMSCAGCGREWAPVLDIVQFFWRELSTTSVQLLDEVHLLATGYGWSEEQVLKISSRRRREYVERIARG